MGLEDEDYEILSKKEIERLKGEIKQLKEGTAPSDATVLSKLNQMIDLFREASISIKNQPSVDERIEKLNEKLNNLLDQNQQIAEGIVAIADMIKGTSQEQPKQPVSIEERLKPVLPPLTPPLPNMMPPQQFEIPKPAFEQQPQFAMPQFPQEMPPLPQNNQQNQFRHMPSLNPMEDAENKGFSSEMPPLPPRPPKKGFISGF